MLQDDKFLRRQAFRIHSLAQLLGRLIERLIRKNERTPMDSDRLPGTDIFMHRHGLFGIHMMIFHEPSWLIGSDRYGCEIERSEPAADLLEVRCISRIAGKKEAEVVGAYDPARPQALVA